MISQKATVTLLPLPKIPLYNHMYILYFICTLYLHICYTYIYFIFSVPLENSKQISPYLPCTLASVQSGLTEPQQSLAHFVQVQVDGALF